MRFLLPLALFGVLLGCGGPPDSTPTERARKEERKTPSKADSIATLALFPEFRKVAEATKLGPEADGFYATEFNVTVSTDCVRTLGPKETLRWIQGTMLEGGACLRTLGGDGADENFLRLRSLLGTVRQPVRIQCHSLETSRTSETLGRATLPGERNHPSVSVSPTVLGKDAESRKGVLFHELFHNMGYRHLHDVEYPYACEACCFPTKTTWRAEKEAACKVCRSTYHGVHDRHYVRDAVRFLELAYRNERGGAVLEKYLSQHLGDDTGNREFLVALPRAYRFVNPAYAQQLAEAVRARYRDLEETEIATLAMAEGHAKKLPVDHLVAAGALAQATLKKLDGKVDQITGDLRLFQAVKLDPTKAKDSDEKDSILELFRKKDELAWELVHHYDALKEKATRPSEKQKYDDQSLAVFLEFLDKRKR